MKRVFDFIKAHFLPFPTFAVVVVSLIAVVLGVIQGFNLGKMIIFYAVLGLSVLALIYIVYYDPDADPKE